MRKFIGCIFVAIGLAAATPSYLYIFGWSPLWLTGDRMFMGVMTCVAVCMLGAALGFMP
jgi:hypothetical protein